MQLSQILMSMAHRINSSCANFLWKSKIHKLRWDDVCKPKNKGGLGIKSLDDTVKAVAIKLVWKFIQGDSLWAKWMHSKYCSTNNFWTTNMNNNASYTWKLLLRAREWCKGLIDRKIANGNSRDLWADPWLNGYSLIDKFGDNDMYVVGGNRKKHHV